MKTFPITDDSSGRTIAFEIENAYISPSTVVAVLASVEGFQKCDAGAHSAIGKGFTCAFDIAAPSA